MPKVSVVVPNYNHARFVRQRIETILAQTFQDFELILLDDCSTDDSRAILQEYASDPRVRLEFNEVNSGSTFKQWNKGVRLARGKYVWIAESDDYADPRFLERLVSRLGAEPRAAFAYCRSWRVSEHGQLHGFQDSLLSSPDTERWSADFLADGPEECRERLIRGNSIFGASSAVFRKDAYLMAGGADESLVYCGDWKTWAAMALAGGMIAYVGDPLNYYRFHDASVTSKSEQSGVWPGEALYVVGWMLERLGLDRAARAKICDDLSWLWVPPVLDRRVPPRLRWTIIKRAAAVDRRAPRRLIRPALTALRLTLRRRWRSLRAASSQ